MYSSLLTEDTYKRADAVYKSIADEFTPYLKDYINISKTHDKNVIEEGKSDKACQAATIKIGIAASTSPGCKDVGKCIMDIAETMQEVNMARDAWVQKFRNEILYPIERRSEQDGKYVVGLHKKSQDEFKARSSETEKVMLSLQKLNKRSWSKPNSRKAEEKRNKTTEKLLSAKVACETVAHEMLSRAFSEERRRYCFFVEKQCDLVQACIEYHRTAAEILQANIDQWKPVGASHSDLLPGAVALIESSRPRCSNVTLDELDMNMGIRHDQGSSNNDRNSSEYSTMSARPVVTNIRLKRNATTRIPSSPKEVDIYNPAAENEITEKDGANGGMTGENGAEVKNAEKMSENDSQANAGRLSPSSPDMKMTFRRSDGSHISVSSQASCHSPELKEDARKSQNDSGISVEEFGNAEQEAKETAKLNEHFQEKQPDKGDQSNELESGSPGQESKRSSTISKNSSEGSSAKVETWYESLYDYNPDSGGNKLGLRRGDRISVYNGEAKGGWMYGTNKRNNQSGWFPINYTTLKMTDPEETEYSSVLLTTQEETTPPPSPFIFNPNKDERLPTPTPTAAKPGVQAQSPIFISTFGKSPTTPNESSPSDEDPKKSVIGRNVFQFAKDLGNPNEETHLQKTTKEQLH